MKSATRPRSSGCYAAPTPRRAASSVSRPYSFRGTSSTTSVGWITDDEPDGLHREAWRRTQQRFGLVEWRADHARLTITLGPDQPFIPRYFEARQPTGRRRRRFRQTNVNSSSPPRGAWSKRATPSSSFAPSGTLSSRTPARSSSSTTKVSSPPCCPRRRPDRRARRRRGVVRRWRSDSEVSELGVAIHHGALPVPFRREVERLLQLGSLEVTIASPTLAQGLNLSASAVVFTGSDAVGTCSGL